MTDQWIAHVKATQRYYKEQGTPITYHQALFAARKSYAQVKQGQQPKFEVEDVPPHNTKPRQKEPTKTHARKVVYREESEIENDRSKPRGRPRKPQPESESYSEESDRPAPRRRPPPRREEDDYEYEEERPAPRRRPPPRDDYEYEEERPRRRPPPRRDDYDDRY